MQSPFFAVFVAEIPPAASPLSEMPGGRCPARARPSHYGDRGEKAAPDTLESSQSVPSGSTMVEIVK